MDLYSIDPKEQFLPEYIYNSLVGQVKDVLDTGTVTPAVNQVECHAFFNQRKLKAFLDERNITLGRAVGTQSIWKDP